MKKLCIAVCVFSLCSPLAARVARAADLPANDGAFVDVERSSVDFAGKPAGEITALLWREFGVPEKGRKMLHATTENWPEKVVHYRDNLIFRAAQQGMDAESLKKSLGPVAGKKAKAMLPVGAYLAHSGKSEVWVVVYLWEYAPKDKPVNLDHVFVKAVNAKTQAIVGAVNCY